MTPVANPVVSVCIANYNGMGYIDNCLRSVMEQDCDFPIEIIVHDDASQDGSAAYIRKNYPTVALIESDKNLGFCIANNRMANNARGEFLLLLNNDAELFPDALHTFYDAAKSVPHPAILGLPQYDAANGKIIDRGSVFDPFLNPIPNLDLLQEDVGMIIGACLWIPGTLWKEIGGFPDWFNTLAEDMYVCCVARLWGYPVKVLNISGFRHWVGKSLGGGKVTPDNRLVTSRKRRALSERNKSFVMVMTYPALLLSLILPLHLLTMILEGLILSTLKWEWRLMQQVYLGCVRSLWSDRKRLLLYRRRVQAQSCISHRIFMSVFTLFPYKLRLLLRHGLPKIN